MAGHVSMEIPGGPASGARGWRAKDLGAGGPSGDEIRAELAATARRQLPSLLLLVVTVYAVIAPLQWFLLPVAGRGVGVAAAATALIFAGIWLWARRRSTVPSSRVCSRPRSPSRSS